MKLNLSRNWIILLLAVILPLLLLTVAMLVNSGICIFMSILLWIGMLMVAVLIPYFKE